MHCHSAGCVTKLIDNRKRIRLCGWHDSARARYRDGPIYLRGILRHRALALPRGQPFATLEGQLREREGSSCATRRSLREDRLWQITHSTHRIFGTPSDISRRRVFSSAQPGWFLARVRFAFQHVIRKHGSALVENVLCF